MPNGILLTGSTGFLGTQIAVALSEQTENIIYAGVRAQDTEEALHRLKTSWFPFTKLYQKIGTQVIPVCMDITEENIGLSSQDAEMLRKNVSVIFHTAAETGLQVDKDILNRINYAGTLNVLALAKETMNLKRFVYISTAYVAGTRTGLILEDDPLPDTFASFYEQSKANAEKAVRNAGLPVTVIRPGMIIGDSRNGWTRNFNTVYYALKLYLTKKLSILPVSKDMILNLVPVDYVAETAVAAAFSAEAEGSVFHVTCPQELQPEIGELLEYVRTWASVNLNTTLPVLKYMPVAGVKKAGLLYNHKEEGRKKNLLTNLLSIAPYVYDDKCFDRLHTDALMGKSFPKWQDYIDMVLSYACRKNFMQQNGWTVFEQANARRNSTRYPVHYFDVAADGLHKVSGKEVNEQIEKIVDAFYAWGIRKGDKIALTGINSVAYMTIDMAIGLIGAVSVPIYYTTPIEEVQILLEKSGSKWLFVGDKRIMKNIEQLSSDIKVVAFSEGLRIHKPNVIHWEQFLYRADAKAPAQYADPEDLATIRYTSGTTGDPKGVKFNYSQLAWMGEILTNLVDWQERNQTMRYLSFLPLSHVVEGILASYAPYYLLCDTEFYFLNDFGSLTEALPKVRPNVFFSVPRFYEKLWDQLSANKIGKKYLSMKKGPAKKALGSVLRNVILKKAGLDACKQLIVGSAPISEELLLNFRELGIEIYNAYGQAEAPLITINRMNDNVIPTIGTPLPETTVTIADDGELIVTGPQVCLGYYGLETDTIKDGVLKTGDLGELHENGHITLYGRKKEMIITAYGKNISIPKIEERLKNIPGVSEAVLIGENKPYCTALLWVEREIENLDQQIDEMNQNLSHPETIRKYTIIDKPLSIQDKELTPNLKVRRKNVEAHYQKEIEEMYR